MSRRICNLSCQFPGALTALFALSLAVMAAGASVSGQGAVRAFPGAEGFGTETPGGRGGRVIVVTTLNWNGPGSFYEAITATGPRLIVFRVSGVINVPDGASLNEANSFVTVAGQSSPGGITFTGSYGSVIGNYQTNFHDGVFRYLRFRGRGSYDNIQFNTAHHLVFDHCDFSGGKDETFDITNAHDVTIQWCTITNSDSAGQNYGSLIAYAPTAGFSIHHNFYAHHANRCAPHMHWGSEGVPAGGATIEFSNNVVYNCAFDAVMYLNSAANPDRLSFNIVSNYFKAGPNTPKSGYGYALVPGSWLYEDDNLYPGHYLWSPYLQVRTLAAPAPAPAVTLQPASGSFDLVLRQAGAFPRDPMNARTANEARNGTGTLGKLDDALLNNAPAPPPDSDLDGMADAWEIAHGLNPSDRSDASGDRDGDGYTNIEEYLNELAAALMPPAAPRNLKIIK